MSKLHNGTTYPQMAASLARVYAYSLGAETGDGWTRLGELEQAAFLSLVPTDSEELVEKQPEGDLLALAIRLCEAFHAFLRPGSEDAWSRMTPEQKLAWEVVARDYRAIIEADDPITNWDAIETCFKGASEKYGDRYRNQAPAYASA